MVSIIFIKTFMINCYREIHTYTHKHINTHTYNNKTEYGRQSKLRKTLKLEMGQSQLDVNLYKENRNRIILYIVKLFKINLIVHKFKIVNWIKMLLRGSRVLPPQNTPLGNIIISQLFFKKQKTSQRAFYLPITCLKEFWYKTLLQEERSFQHNN